jgi:predicted DNA-binding protein (MmcQ/YjbR family)
MKWIQRTDQQSIDDDALRDYLAESHRLVAAKLPKRLQRELGIGEAMPERSK